MWWLVPEIVILALWGAYQVGEALVTEVQGPVGKWFAERWNPFWDSEQTPSVRKSALRLASRKWIVRMESARELGELGDSSGVPALVKAVERCRRDGRILEMLVDSLRRLGDERAIPALRGLTSGRHYALMAAAREALAEIEPRSSLLRAADSAESPALLRPAGSANADSAKLLWVPLGRDSGLLGRD